MTRRSTHQSIGAVYAAVGASAADDVLRFPPTGAHSVSRELRLGSGNERFLLASDTLMTWDIFRAADIAVTNQQTNSQSSYSRVSFNAAGVPEPAPEVESRYSADGTPYIEAGTTALFSVFKENQEMRVVYLVDEPDRVGFALGSATDGPMVGEIAIVVERRDDGAVWASARGFFWVNDLSDGDKKQRRTISGMLRLRSLTKWIDQVLAGLLPGVVLGAKQ